MFTSQIEMLIHSRQSLGKTRLYMAPGVASKPQGEIVFIGVVIATVTLMLGIRSLSSDSETKFSD